MLGVFQGLTFVVTISFFVMLPVAAITCVVWPTIQHGIASIQYFIVASGYIGVWLYHFLERVLIPTGLHHFIYAPIEVGPVVVNHGLKAEWLQHLNQFAESNKPLKDNSHMDLCCKEMERFWLSRYSIGNVCNYTKRKS